MPRRETTPPPITEPQISVLITAHNEADRIQSCLQAIVNQDYPMERVEILLVDDRSTDGTADRALAMNLPNLRILRLEEVVLPFTTRQTALDMGIREARGEVVLIADAGGRVPREWIRELSGHIGYRDGAVTAPVIFAGRPRFLARFQTVDSLLTYNFYFWSHRRRSPSGVYAANLAVRRQAYIDIGGFEKIGFAPAPDLALGQALVRGNWDVRFLLGPAVQNLCAPNLNELVARRVRRFRNIPRHINLFFILMILSNLILVGLTVAFGGVWISFLILRYVLGLFFIAAAIEKYGAHRLTSILLYEPVLTFIGAWSYLSWMFAHNWSWGDVTYSATDDPASSVRG